MNNLEIIIFLFIIATIIQITLKPKKKNKNKKPINKKKNSYKPNTKNRNQGYKGLYKQKTSYAEKQQKGKEYEKYISEYFIKNGWISYEHGLEKGWKDGGIDLILKKDNQFLFVQCKNWNKNHKYKMGIKKIKEYREKTKLFMKNNPKISKTILNLNYDIKLIFISSEDIYTQEAKNYIKENEKILEYKIIPMKSNYT